MPIAPSLPSGALAASGPLPAANLTAPSAPLPIADFHRRAWGAPALEALPIDVGPGPAPLSNTENHIAQMPLLDAETVELAADEEVDDDTPFDRAQRDTEAEKAESLDAARRERDAYFYDPYEEEREVQPPRTFWQKALHKLRELIGFEMN